VGEVFARPATTTRQLSGLVGEELLAQHLRDRGFIVIRDWRKHVAGGGIDLSAYNPATQELWHIDNKAWATSDISGADALAIERRYAKSAGEVEHFLREIHPNRAEAELALGAIRANKVRRVVANGFAGEAKGFTPGCFAKGLHVYDIRLGQVYAPAEAAAWRQAHAALKGRAGFRAVRMVRGASTVEAQLVVLVVTGGVLLLVNSTTAAAIAAEFAPTLVAEGVMRMLELPGGFIAGMTLSLESDETESARNARKRNETIDAILSTYPRMSAEDEAASRVTLAQMIDAPLAIPTPPPQAQPVPVVPTPAPVPGPSLPPLRPPQLGGR